MVTRAMPVSESPTFSTPMSTSITESCHASTFAMTIGDLGLEQLATARTLTPESEESYAQLEYESTTIQILPENRDAVQTSIAITGDVATLRRVLDILAGEQSALADGIEGWRREAIRS